MKILLVYPWFLEPRIHEEDIRVPPIGLYYVGAMLVEHGHEVTIVNWHAMKDRPEDMRAALSAGTPDVIGISILHANRWGGIDIARMAKSLDPSVVVVFGGVGATFLWELLLEHVPEIDAVIRCEGEQTMLELVDRLDRDRTADVCGIPGLACRRDGRPQKMPDRPPMPDIDALPDPSRYFTFQHVVASRGCPGNCSFCGSPRFWGRRLRFHAPERFVDQLERLHRNGVEFFYVSDDTFTVQPKRVIAACREIIARKLPITWAAISRVDHVDETMLKWMRLAGCIQISYGIESGSEEIRRRLNKPVRTDQIRRAFDLTRRYGLMARAYFIYGSPGETDGTIDETIALIQDIRPLGAIFYILDIFPGTALYADYLERSGKTDAVWLERIEDILYCDTDPALTRQQIRDWGRRLRTAFHQGLPKFAESVDLVDDPDLTAGHADFLSRLAMTFSHGDYADHPDIPKADDTAERLFRRALSIQPHPRAYLGLAMLLQKRRQFDAAVALLEPVLGRFPRHEELVICLGVSYMNLGEFARALDCFAPVAASPRVAPYAAECRRQLGGQ